MGLDSSEDTFLVLSTYPSNSVQVYGPETRGWAPGSCSSRSRIDGECHAPHDARHLANPATAGPVRPGRLGRTRRALRAAHLSVVPAMEVAGRRRRGRDTGHPGEAHPEASLLRVRPVAQLPRLAQDGR